MGLLDKSERIVGAAFNDPFTRFGNQFRNGLRADIELDVPANLTICGIEDILTCIYHLISQLQGRSVSLDAVKLPGSVQIVFR